MTMVVAEGKEGGGKEGIFFYYNGKRRAMMIELGRARPSPLTHMWLCLPASSCEYVACQAYYQ